MSFNSTFSALSNRGFGGNLPQGWIQQALLQSSDIVSEDQFGTSVSINSDATYLVVGARLEDTAPSDAQGAAYVFTRSGTTWTQQAKILAGDGVTGDLFGSSVSINNAGDTIAVGAPVEDTAPTTDQGAVYIFTRSGTTWTQQAKLLASDGATDDNFATALSLDGTGDYLIVGAGNADIAPNTNCGAAYIFTRSGTTWTQQTKLIAPTRTTNALFGVSVQISNNSSYVVIGAQQFGGVELGKVYVYYRTGSSWSLQLETSGSGNLVTNGNERGRSVTINSDGSTIVFAGSTGSRMWFFNRSGSTWTETQVLTVSTGTPSQQIGTASLSTNNNVTETLIGLQGPNKTINILYNTNYYVAQAITASDLNINDDYGNSVSIAQSINYAAIGAPLSVYPDSKGAVYIIYKPA